MKKILLFLLLTLPVLLHAQYPTTGNKMRLGWQTTGDGLVYRDAGYPSYTPNSRNNAYVYMDTVAKRYYHFSNGAWYDLSDEKYIHRQDQSVLALAVRDSLTTYDRLFIAMEITSGGASDRGVQLPVTALDSTYAGRVVRVSSLDSSGTYNVFVSSSSPDGLLIDGALATTYYLEDGETVEFQLYVFDGLYQWRLVHTNNIEAFPIAPDSGYHVRSNALNEPEWYFPAYRSGDTVAIWNPNAKKLEYVSKATFLSGIPSGSGTAGTLTKWATTTTLGDAAITETATRLATSLPFRLANIATVSLPASPLAGDALYNTTAGNFGFYGSAAWEYPVKSSTSTGLFTPGGILYANAAGRVADATPFLHWDYTNLRLGIGTATPGSKLTTSFSGADVLFESHDFISTYTGGSTAVGGRYRMTMPAGTSASGFIAQSNEVRTATGATTNTGQIGGFNNLALTRHSSGTIASAVGSLDQAYHTGAGTVTLGKGIEGNAVIEGSGTMTTGVGVMGRLQVTGGGTMTNGYGLYVENATVTASTLTNNYALFIKNQTVGTNKFAIWSLSTSDSYLAGQLGLGTTEPDHPLHIFSNDVNFITEALIENNYTGYQARVLNYRRNRDVNMSANDIAGAFSFAGYHNSTRNPNGQIFSNIEGIYRGDGTTRAGAVLINTWDGIGKKGRLYVDENGFTTISREVSGIVGHIGIRLGVQGFTMSSSTDIFSVRDSANILTGLFSVRGNGDWYGQKYGVGSKLIAGDSLAYLVGFTPSGRVGEVDATGLGGDGNGIYSASGTAVTDLEVIFDNTGSFILFNAAEDQNVLLNFDLSAGDLAQAYFKTEGTYEGVFGFLEDADFNGSGFGFKAEFDGNKLLLDDSSLKVLFAGSELIYDGELALSDGSSNFITVSTSSGISYNTSSGFLTLDIGTIESEISSNGDYFIISEGEISARQTYTNATWNFGFNDAGTTSLTSSILFSNTAFSTIKSSNFSVIGSDTETASQLIFDVKESSSSPSVSDASFILSFSTPSSETGVSPSLVLAHKVLTSPGTNYDLGEAVSGMDLGTIGFGSGDASNNNLGAIIRAKSTEDWDGSSRGTELIVATVQNGSTSLTQRLGIDRGGITQESYINQTSTSSPVQLQAGDNLINQGGTQATFTFNLPGSPADGTICRLVFINSVTTCSVGGGTILGASVTTATAGDVLEYKYYTSGTTWVRIQ